MNPPGTDPSPAPASSPGAGASVQDWLNWLEAIHPAEIDLGLDRVLVVLRRLFPRKPNARIITVAGTNGKGTTVATLEKLLQAAGRTTGAYTSPHLQDYNERVRLNGTDISDPVLVSAFEKVEEARGKVSLTYFEFGTLAAFVAFADAGVEDWILEVGLGGRLDAVNVLDAEFAVITSIDIDHIGFLGDNREVIGFEKAGILRPGIFAVFADPESPASVLQQAAAQKVDLQVTGRDYQLAQANGDANTVELTVAGDQIKLPAGPLPVQSVAAAVVLARKLLPDVAPSSLGDIARTVSVPGRFELLARSPFVRADVGHNPHAARWLSGQVSAGCRTGSKVHAVYAALADKDVEGVMTAMKSVADQWYFAGLDVPRGLAVDQLVSHARACGITDGEGYGSVGQALDAAIANARPDDCIVVFGSFYTVAEARAKLAGAGS
ncbi:bifunctional tetrahydrofolate synthase/dihydrofolate synthase [Marinobacter vinifirmus]|uniref:Dihydrofolate synthase/folylpolyglutamate synthase n=1 Tax=Marinobacter vinifirmus TaxID=355591 RepID=A0A558B8N2_9GAMM|nr:bifunctional tetrahydrofolate synthase/dihydrofolate synthase [Marinobacter vinifirmus]TVT32869.1 MAG: bifunctional tetrahydrofolate synthase/dihydrofolate synthase [Marinobacter vinifirmus]